MSPQITAIFQRFDVNDDGVVGAWELKAMLDAGEIIVFDGLTVSPAVVGLSTQPHEVVENDESPEPLDPFGLITPVLDTTVDVLQDVTDSVV